ncbi:helix-turn-helix domain-containing protein [Anthocerotibacter panamensis]
MEPLPFLHERRRHTQRYEAYIYQQVQQSSMEQVSRQEEL